MKSTIVILVKQPLLPLAFASITDGALLSIGLVYIPASSWNILAASGVVWSGLMAVVFLKRRYQWSNYFGISMVVVGAVLAGCSDILYAGSHQLYIDDEPVYLVIFGIICTVSGQFEAYSVD